MKSELLQQLKPYSGRKVLVTTNQSTNDIIKELLKAHSENASEYDKICEQFWTGNEKRTLRKIFDYCKKNIRYEIEPDELQTVKSPSAIIAQGKGDCKHYASFCNGLISAINRKYGTNMNNVFRFAGYNIGATEPQHVYCAVRLSDNKTTIILDPVLETYNDEKPASYIKDKEAMLYRISGMGQTVAQKMNTAIARHSAEQMTKFNAVLNALPFELKSIFKKGFSLFPKYNNGLIPSNKSLEGWAADVLEKSGMKADANKLRDYWLSSGRFQKNTTIDQDIKKGIDKAISDAREVFLKISLSIPRNAFLLLVKANVFGLAVKLARAWNAGERQKIEGKWINDFGGAGSSLQKAIKDGIKSYNYYNDRKEKTISGAKIGVEPVTTTAAAGVTAGQIVAALPVLVPILELLKVDKKTINDIQKGVKVVQAGQQGYQNFQNAETSKDYYNAALNTYKQYQEAETNNNQDIQYFTPEEQTELTEIVNSALGSVITMAAATKLANLYNTIGALQQLKRNVQNKDIQPDAKAATVVMIDKRIEDVAAQKQRNPKEIRFQDQKLRLPSLPGDKSRFVESTLSAEEQKSRLPGDKSRFVEPTTVQSFFQPLTSSAPTQFVPLMDDKGNIEIKEMTQEQIEEGKPEGFKPNWLLLGGLAAGAYLLTRKN